MIIFVQAQVLVQYYCEISKVMMNYIKIIVCSWLNMNTKKVRFDNEIMILIFNCVVSTIVFICNKLKFKIVLFCFGKNEKL